MRNLRLRNNLIGVISDTHGLLRPEVFEIFRDVSLILHAGDIGSSDVLDALKTLGARDCRSRKQRHRRLGKADSQTEVAKVGRVKIYMIHDVKTITWDSVKKCDVVVSGHSHRPSIDERNGTLLLNPGSAGPRRFKLPISVATISINGTIAHAVTSPPRFALDGEGDRFALPLLLRNGLPAFVRIEAVDPLRDLDSVRAEVFFIDHS